MTETPNLDYIKELAAGSLEFEQRLIGIVKREFPEEKSIFLQNYEIKNFKQAAENVHKLKHKIGMLGYEKGYQTTIDFEEELLEGKFTLYSKFMSILESIEQFLKMI